MFLHIVFNGMLESLSYIYPYTGIVEAVLASKDDKDGDNDDQVADVGLSKIDSLFCCLILLAEGAQDKAALHHN